MRIAVRHDDHVARVQLNLHVTFESNKSRPLNHKMINDKMRRVLSEQFGQFWRGRRVEAPRRGELRVEVQRALQHYSAKYF